MKDALEKKINLSDKYSLATMQAFAEFLYRGAEYVQKAILSSQLHVDYMEFLSFAEEFQVEPLITCCTNLICVFATKEDLPVINELALKYPQLQKLGERLEKIPDASSEEKIQS